MKILYVSTISNTVNSFLVPHINMLVKDGHKVDVAFKISQPVHNKIRELECRVYNINFNRSPLFNNYFKLIKQVKQIVMEGEYDIIHTHTPTASAIVRIACRNLSNVKVIYTAHGFHFYRGAPLMNWVVFYPIERILARFTDLLITINSEDYEVAKKFKTKKTVLVPGVGVDIKNGKLTSFDSDKKKYEKKNTSSIVFISVGELNNNKNHKLVIEALSKLNEYDLQYLIVGEGVNKNKLIDQIKELGLEDKVQLLGYRDDVMDLLELSDILIFPSFREGLPKSIMEAMAVGLPILASNIRGNIDLVDDGKGGYLFDPNDSNDLKEKIKLILSEDTKLTEYSKYNRNKIKDYSINKILKKINEVYNSLL